METGRKILNLRKDLGVPQKSLAENTAVTPSALSRIEAGIHQPRGPVALRIARQLGVTVDYLLDDTAPYPPPAWVLLANLEPREPEPTTETTPVSRREKQMLEAMREMTDEQRVFLESVLRGSRRELRLATSLLRLGPELPAVELAELDEYRNTMVATLGLPLPESSA